MAFMKDLLAVFASFHFAVLHCSLKTCPGCCAAMLYFSARACISKDVQKSNLQVEVCMAASMLASIILKLLA